MDDEYDYYDDAYNEYGEYADYGGEVEETWETPLQTKYDDAKAVIDTDPTTSVRLLKEVVAEDPQHGLWTFKCLKKLARASRNAKQYDDMLGYQQQFMHFSSDEVDDTMRMRAMTKFVEKAPRLPRDYQMRALEATLTAAQENLVVCEKLWLNTTLRKATLLMDEGLDAAAIEVLSTLLQWHRANNITGVEPQLCMAYSLLLRCYHTTRQPDLARETFFAAMEVDTANGTPVPQRVLAANLEWGGHVYLRDADWHAAYRAFHAAFRYYSDCGDGQAAQALKYAVVADMITGSPVDSFAANEAKANAESPSVLPVARLLTAFIKNDVAAAVVLLRDPANEDVFVHDPFMAPYVEPLLFRLRLNALVRYVTSFTTVLLADVADRLCLESVEEATDLCTFAILQRLITASIDDSTAMLRVHSTAQSSEIRRAEALLSWSTRLTGAAH